MRTTVELPDELMMRAKRQAAAAGISIKELFIEAIEEKLTPATRKVRRPPPVIGGPGSRRITILTPEELDAAMFG